MKVISYLSYERGQEIQFDHATETLGEFFYMYMSVIYDMGVGISFTVFQSEVWRNINIAISQLYSNNWAFVRV